MTAIKGKLAFSFFLIIIMGVHGRSIAGWPVQKAPLSIVKCRIDIKNVREANLAQSVSGLAAQALNEGLTTEGVWIQGSANYDSYYPAFIHRVNAVDRGFFDVWQLIRRYAEKGIIKGYVLYDATKKDNSINLATVLCGIEKGVLVDIRQEKRARLSGLVKLCDVRGKMISISLFDSLKRDLNNHLICLLKPSMFNDRDYAIAHKSMVYYGTDNLLDTILRWVTPLSPVIGWNQGPEFDHISPCTKYGLFNTATDWCQNLAMLSVTASQVKVQAFKCLDPRSIDFSELKNFHAFVLSDGDNMQWAMGNFIHNPEYWANKSASRIPMSFSTCAVNLSVAARDVYNKLVKSQPEYVSVVEFGGGYYYPDLFALYRQNRDSLLRSFAAYLNRHMKLNGTNVPVFICKDVSSDAAKKAYKIFAEELEGIVGMIVIQYAPYNGGHGSIYWVKNGHNIDVPVVTASYQLWTDLRRPGSGGPDSVAHWIDKIDAPESILQEHFGWTIVHAWSSFKKPLSGKRGEVRKGVDPVVWTKELIQDPNEKIVNIEELLWRLRMKHNAGQTKEVITHWSRTME